MSLKSSHDFIYHISKGYGLVPEGSVYLFCFSLSETADETATAGMSYKSGQKVLCTLLNSLRLRKGSKAHQ